MAHFAHVDPVTNIVDNVIVVADHDTGFIARHWPDPENWIQTSYNTKGGEHVLGGTPLRKNFAGIGYTFDRAKDAFIPPKPFESFVLDETSCTWKSPKEAPKDGKKYIWSEKDADFIDADTKTP